MLEITMGVESKHWCGPIFSGVQAVLCFKIHNTIWVTSRPDGRTGKKRRKIPCLFSLAILWFHRFRGQQWNGNVNTCWHVCFEVDGVPLVLHGFEGHQASWIINAQKRMWLVMTTLKTGNLHTAHIMSVFPRLLDLSMEKEEHTTGGKHYCHSNLCEPVEVCFFLQVINHRLKCCTDLKIKFCTHICMFW